MSPGRWIAFLGAGLLLGLGTFTLITRTPPQEAVELAVAGSEKQLREPLRPIRGTTRVLLIALDGVGADDLQRAIDQGRMPALTGLLGPSDETGFYAHGIAIPDVLSILPSITMAAWSTVYTGRPSGETGVPGNEWFDRQAGRLFAPAPVSVKGKAHTAMMYTDGLLGAQIRVPTLFERMGVRVHVSLAPVFRGADVLTLPSVEMVAGLFAAVAEGVAEDDRIDQEVYQEVDELGVEHLLEAIDHHGLPDLQVAYFPGVDLYTHVTREPLQRQQEYLQTVIDPGIARILQRYRDDGALDRTFVVITADHGHTPVKEDDLHALETELEGEPPAVLQQLGFRVRPFELERGIIEGKDEIGAVEDAQAVMAYAGTFAFVYLADRSTCPEPGEPCDWGRPPRPEEDLLPVVRAFFAASAEGEGVPELEGTLDLVLARLPPAEGASWSETPFGVFDGERLVPLREYLAAHPRPDLLDFAERLDALALGPQGSHAGDVLLMARAGMHRDIDQRFYFSGRYRSWHGSACPQDSEVPLIIAHPGLPGEEIRERVEGIIGGKPSQQDVAPLIEGLLEER